MFDLKAFIDNADYFYYGIIFALTKWFIFTHDFSLIGILNDCIFNFMLIYCA